MADAATGAAVRRILAAVLGDAITGVEDPARADLERWDSLAALEIVFMLEEEFDRRLTEPELARLGSLSEIVAVVGDRG